MELHEQVWRAIDELCHEWESQAQDIAAVVLGFEVSPGVTLGDAVRAYLALEVLAGPHESGPFRFTNPTLGYMLGRDAGVWAFDGDDSVLVSRASTLAAAILAAADAEIAT